jgi:DEAD/DEAH box helicase domain-containing protein
MWVELPGNMQERVMNHVDSDDVIAPSESAADQGMQSPAEWTFCGGLHGAEHGMIKLSPLELRIDNSDIGGLSTPYHRETGCPTWFIHDGIDGGIGFAHSIYEHFTDIAEKTRDRVGNCSCDDVTGCPSCLMSDQCGNDNEPLHKITTQLILHAVLQRISAKN